MKKGDFIGKGLACPLALILKRLSKPIPSACTLSTCLLQLSLHSPKHATKQHAKGGKAIANTRRD